MNKFVKLAVAGVALVAFAGAAHAEGDAEKGKKVAKICLACHTFDDGGKNKIGPNLFGVVGRTIGTVEGFKYSKGYKALGEAGKVWDEETLRAYIPNAKKFLKAEGVATKSKMTPQNVKGKKMDNLIAYLNTLTK
jgi:cytochrome c